MTQIQKLVFKKRKEKEHNYTFPYLFLKFYLFIYFWLCWVFVAAWAFL